jgi:hypothetical protein
MSDSPRPASEHIVRGLSLPRRVGQAAAGLAGLLVAGLIALLWATEPTSLPVRTQVAFAALIAVGLTWAGLAGWALARRPLFAIDRVLAAALALCFSTLWTVWAAALAWSRGGGAALVTVAGVGLVLVLASGALLRRAHAYRATLLERQRVLEGRSAGADHPRRTPLPIGPLALALRRRGATGRTTAVLTAVLVVALLAGLALVVAR